MRFLGGGRASWVVFLLLSAPGAAAAQEGRVVAGRVLDEATRQPVPDVALHIQNTTLRAVTGEDGRFRIAGVAPGTYVLTVEHLAYGQRLEAVVVRPGQDVTLELRLSMRPIQIDPVVVEGRTELEQRRLSTGFAMNEILRPQIDAAARQGLTLWELLRDGMPQVSVREQSRGFATCVEFRGAASTGGTCQPMAIFIDGVHMSAPGTVYPNIPLNDIERVEAISPGQAGVQYGTLGGSGVLLIETRQGPRPNRGADTREPLTFGFDWSAEAEPYRWSRVTSAAVIANAVGLGVGFAATRGCLELDGQMLGVTEECGGLRAFAAGSAALLLPVLASSYATRWGGATSRSRGRMIPAAILGSAAAITGYLLLIEGQEVGGGALLLLGTPAFTIFADRAFRVLR